MTHKVRFTKYSLCAIFAASLLIVASAATAFADEHEGEGKQSSGSPDHIYYIMMENHATNQIIGNTADAPFINQLARHNGVALNYHGVTHPSLPNYLAAISGNFQGIFDDCKAGATVTCAPEEFVPGAGDATDPGYAAYSTPGSPLYKKVPPQLSAAQIATASNIGHMFAGQTIVDQLEAKGMTWKGYSQSKPFAGADTEFWPTLGSTTYKMYAQKHDPFMYFSDIRSNPARMAKLVTLPQLDYDLANNQVPNFVFIAPDQCNDMHGVGNGVPVGYPTCSYPASGLDHGAIQLGDAFLRDTVNKIANSRAWTHDSVMVIVWDEDDYNGYPSGCCGSPVAGVAGTDGTVLGGAITPAIVITNREHGRISTRPYNHYSLLATIQNLWNLPCLANTCSIAQADLMLDLF